MADFGIKLIGDQRVALRFETFPDAAKEALAKRITELTAELVADIQAGIPRGKTGALAAQLRSGVEVQQSRIRGWISFAGGDVNAIRKAGALEFGSRGLRFAVQGYTRQMDHVFGKFVEPFEQVVQAYKRHNDIEARNFIHGPLEAAGPSIAADLQAVVKEALEKAE